MDIALQVWGGGSYLINKVLFALAEGKTQQVKRQCRLLGWVMYISGVPAWVIVLLSEQNWIAASIEAGGIPSMLLGFYTVYKKSTSPNKHLDTVASIFTYGSIVLGGSYSIFDYGGITSFTQVLEIGVMLGFLLGSYLFATNNRNGWLFFMLMNGSMATLMLIQHKPLLATQQMTSLCFVVYGFKASRRTKPL